MGKIQSQYTRPAEVRQAELSDRLLDEQLLSGEELTPSSSLDAGTTLRERRARRLRDTKQTYESLDYDRCENQLWRRRFAGISSKAMKQVKSEHTRRTLARWGVIFLIGTCTALVAFTIDKAVEYISEWKFDLVHDLMSTCEYRSQACISRPYGILLGINMAFVAAAVVLCAYVAPSAAGSGIPEIKCALNGVKRRDWLTFKTMVVKIVGVIFGVSATMPIGKEGPMIHSGAIIGAGLPQGRSTRLGWDLQWLRFRSDREKRDFVAAGAASGVAAAFGAPIGGVLFSLEEGASFWNQSLTWRILFCTMAAFFVLHLMYGVAQGSLWDGSQTASGGLVSFGDFSYNANLYDKRAERCHGLEDPIAQTKCYSGAVGLWKVYELFIFALMGAMGGLAGALWVRIQRAITIWRAAYVRKRPAQVAEALFICFLNTSIMFAAAMYLGECYPTLGQGLEFSNGVTYRSYFCARDPGSQAYNDMATLVLNPLGHTIKHLLHQPLAETISVGTCAAYFLLLAVTSCWTYGLVIPSGLFVPALVAGAAFGRLVGQAFNQFTPYAPFVGTYAVMGAAAFLGGVVRMTISLTVILVEATNEVTYGLPIMITLIAAKLVGDYFNQGIYDTHIHLKRVPLLEWDAETEMKRYTSDDVMATDLKCVRRVSRVGDIVALLRGTTHHGFPVVETRHTPFENAPSRWEEGRGNVGSSSSSSSSNSSGSGGSDGGGGGGGADGSVPVGGGRFVGLILRHQLVTMLQLQCYGARSGHTTDQIDLEHSDFLRKYPQRTPIEHVALPPGAENAFIDVSRYMNPTPFTLGCDTPLPRVFSLYRSLGLRHIPVLSGDMIVGIITRKELTLHRLHELGRDFDGFVSQAATSRAQAEQAEQEAAAATTPL
eukprot:UC1_evm1s221